MTLSILITDDSEEGKGTIVFLAEYNPDGEFCGTWVGIMTDRTFKGEGEFLGKTLPFELTQCKYSDTDF